MSTYELTWNPSKWTWHDLGDAIYRVNNDIDYRPYWSCGSRKNISPGDRFILMKLGKDPRGIKKGIVGYGYIESSPFEELHWDPQLANSGKKALRVDLKFIGLNDHPFISSDDLDRRFPTIDWMPQAGGVVIPDDVADQLFNEFDVGFDTRVPTKESGVLVEGSVREITIKSYDRSPLARQRCIEAHGYTCSVCHFNFEEVYGALGECFIEVHHTKPIASYGGTHQIDPVMDLRPVCANCHRVIHRNNPPLGVDELQDILKNLAVNPRS
jgi:5-methylcytosine-specific restriction enzyme A